jgi:hypothetical protein
MACQSPDGAIAAAGGNVDSWLGMDMDLPRMLGPGRGEATPQLL